MSKVFYVKQGDTLTVEAWLTKRNNKGKMVPEDLTGATVVFTMKSQATGTVKVDEQSATIEDAKAGHVKYAGTTTDTNLSGEDATDKVIYDSEWEVTFADSSVKTFPNSDLIPHLIVIEPELS